MAETLSEKLRPRELYDTLKPFAHKWSELCKRLHLDAKEVATLQEGVSVTDDLIIMQRLVIKHYDILSDRHRVKQMLSVIETEKDTSLYSGYFSATLTLPTTSLWHEREATTLPSKTPQLSAHGLSQYQEFPHKSARPKPPETVSRPESPDSTAADPLETQSKIESEQDLEGEEEVTPIFTETVVRDSVKALRRPKRPLSKELLSPFKEYRAGARLSVDDFQDRESAMKLYYSLLPPHRSETRVNLERATREIKIRFSHLLLAVLKSVRDKSPRELATLINCYDDRYSTLTKDCIDTEDIIQVLAKNITFVDCDLLLFIANELQDGDLSFRVCIYKSNLKCYLKARLYIDRYYSKLVLPLDIEMNVSPNDHRLIQRIKFIAQEFSPDFEIEFTQVRHIMYSIKRAH